MSVEVSTSWWSRHRRWAVPLVVGVALLYGPAVVENVVWGSWSAAIDGSVWFALVYLAGFLGAVVAALATLVGAHRAYRAWRRSRGHLTAGERHLIDQQRASLVAWEGACRLRSDLLARRVPPALPTRWDLVSAPGEHFMLEIPATYARYYGTDAVYTHRSGFFFGHPAFVLAGLAMTAAANASSQSAAARTAVPQWREYRTVSVRVSNQRIACDVGGRWLSFWFSGVSAIYPDVRAGALVLQFPDTQPLLLSGRFGALIAVLAMHQTHGPDALVHHPEFTGMNPLPRS